MPNMNNKLKSFLSKLPANVTKDLILTNEKIKIPGNIDISKFEKIFINEINSDQLTTEKAIYAGFLFRSKEDKDAKTMLFEYIYKT